MPDAPAITRRRRWRPGVRTAVGLLLALQAALLAWSAYRHTPVVDEVAHLPAGIFIWETGRFDLYRVNPPLVKAVAAVPVVLAGPQTDWSRFTPHPVVRPAWNIGRDFIAANGRRSFWYFTLARWAVIPLILAGGWFCYRWAAELHGATAGLLALGLWCVSPSILGNGALITPDAAAAAMGIGAGYTFWRWLRQPSWPRAFAAGLMLGLTELAKATWIVLFGLWPLLWLVWVVAEKRRRPAENPSGADSVPRRRRSALQLTATLVLGLYVLNLGYVFDGSLKPLKEYRFVSKLFAGEDAYFTAGDPGGNRFAETPLGLLPVPFPEDYLVGVDVQRRDFEKKSYCYLRGEWKKGGWWYWYLYALAVKVPLGLWLLVFLAGWTSLRPGGIGWRDGMLLLVPPLAVLLLVSSQTGMTRFFRYVLPMLPFLFVWASGAVRHWSGQPAIVRAVAPMATGWVVVSSLLVHPHSLSYFNELAGGPRGGHEHLLGANIEWGQDYIFLKEWLEANPRARPLHLTGHGGFDPRMLGIEYEAVPRDPRSYRLLQESDLAEYGPLPGWYAVGVQQHHHVSGIYDYFPEFFEPVARAGYSIYVYHITPDEANRVRRKMGLPEVER